MTKSRGARDIKKHRERKKAKGLCAWIGCNEIAVGLYCPGHSSSRNRATKPKPKPKEE